MNESTLTERGQVSVPASLRKAMNLHTGQRLKFERVSDSEFRVVVKNEEPVGPLAMLGYARKIGQGAGRTTAEWMKKLREGEEA